MLFGRLSTGVKRLIIALSAVWLVGWYFAHKEDFNFWWTGLWTTPSTLCSDVYQPDDPQLNKCESAGAKSVFDVADRIGRQRRGESQLFDIYQEEQDVSKVLWWWVGVPILLLVLARLAHWVLAGFRSEEVR